MHNSRQTSNSSSKEIYQYDAPWSVFALDWSKCPHERKAFRMAIGSFIEDSNNKLQVIQRTDLIDGVYGSSHQPRDFTAVAEADSHYPLTKVLWEPWRGDARNSDLLATTGDILRIWELVDNPRYGNTSNSINSSSGRSSPPYYMQQLVKKAELVNMKQTDFCAPLTSFDWNETDPSLIVTASIDTTCTVWNVETNQAKTQLIAHDSDVYDVGFMHGSADIFASVGADGSVRLFDLRSLEHSTILYEAPPAASNVPRRSNGEYTAGNPGTFPLLRLQFNRCNPNLLATFHMDSSAVQILDIRYPSAPVAELVKGHQGSVNCISWSTTQSDLLSTGGEDSQVLVWSIQRQMADVEGSHRHSYYQQPSQQQRHSQQLPRSVKDPVLAYTAESEINSLSWSKGAPEWIGTAFGKTVQALHV
ncbi:WD40-repeat-containing domain protein [Radiomyces spectabilis]|uniref:WD40-repeat-containing domain protein n=1 Tax=Radiomyces spectabilis TaxID=64574 RepID=UPI00221E8451|nr:WD40-repeat-containing domain protein [Radiomyces spectabilis]KAI8380985.1 WD40-repeat-containing domain protein [Radiomyces spectabilis]